MHLVEEGRHEPRTTRPEEYFEDGTLPFLQIKSLKHGFEALSNIGGGMPAISERTFKLAKELYERMSSLKHGNGQKLADIYCSANKFDDIKKQGGILTFNLLKSDASHFGFNAFRRVAEQEGVVVRVGCFCNVGACQTYLK